MTANEIVPVPVAARVIAVDVLKVVVTVWLVATGGGGAFTTIDIVATLLSAPLFALNVKVSVPEKPAFGVYVKFGAVPVNVPLAGAATTEYVNVPVPVADNVTAIAVPNGVVSDCPLATGGCGVTLIDTVAAGLVDVPSFAVKVKASAPTYPAAGV